MRKLKGVKVFGDSGEFVIDIQEKLTAGKNITIENNVISASGGVDEKNLPRAVIL